MLKSTAIMAAVDTWLVTPSPLEFPKQTQMRWPCMYKSHHEPAEAEQTDSEGVYW